MSIAAIIPAHDAMPYVIDAVHAALTQERRPDEVVVVDDRSSDGTGAAVRDRFGDAVRIIEGRFGSAAAARNAGWRAARSTWIAFLDADDTWLPAKTRVALATLERAPRAAWFFSDGAFRTLDGVTHPSWLATYADLHEGYVGQPVAQLVEVNFVLTSSVVVRRDALEAVGGFDETLSHAEDVDLWIRIARRWPACASREPLVRYQHREGGLTRQLEARLGGDVRLFSRLAADPDLARPVRTAARRRAALARYKLAIAALREGRGAEARAHLGGAAPAAGALARAAAWTLSWLPHAWIRAVRGQAWATRGVAARSLRLRRVRLASEPAGTSPGAGTA